MKFITRIPRPYQRGAERNYSGGKNTWTVIDKENRYYEYPTNHLGINQRWFVIYSDAARLRTSKTVDKEIKKEFIWLEIGLKHLGNEVFDCEGDAKKSDRKIIKETELS